MVCLLHEGSGQLPGSMESGEKDLVLLDSPSDAIGSFKGKQGEEKRDSEKRRQIWHETTHKNMEKLLGIQKTDINKKEKKGTKHNRIWGVIEISIAVCIHLADILKSPRLFFVWLFGGFPR